MLPETRRRAKALKAANEGRTDYRQRATRKLTQDEIAKLILSEQKLKVTVDVLMEKCSRSESEHLYYYKQSRTWEDRAKILQQQLSLLNHPPPTQQSIADRNVQGTSSSHFARAEGS